jgi:4-hydroxy-tetrahydrodipicolinate synthase
MTGFAYPEMMRDVVTAAKAGDMERAHDIFDAYLPLIRFETQPGLGLAIRKEILARRGAIAHATVRRPGPKLTPESLAELDWLMARLEVRLGASFGAGRGVRLGAL